MSTRSPAASPSRLAWSGVEDGADPRQLDEVVAPADRPEALDVTGGNVARPRRPRPGRRRPARGPARGRGRGTGRRAAPGTARLSLMGNTAMPQPMSEPTRNGYSTVDAMAAPMGAPLPGCRSGMAATWIMPSRAATWWHCASGVGLDPARGGGEHGDGGRPAGGRRQGLLPGVVLRQGRSLLAERRHGRTASRRAVGAVAPRSNGVLSVRTSWTTLLRSRPGAATDFPPRRRPVRRLPGVPPHGRGSSAAGPAAPSAVAGVGAVRACRRTVLSRGRFPPGRDGGRGAAGGRPGPRW